MYSCPFCKAVYHLSCWNSYGKNVCTICRSAIILVPRRVTRKGLLELINNTSLPQLVTSLARVHTELKFLLEQLKNPKQLSMLHHDYKEAVKSVRNSKYKPKFQTCSMVTQNERDDEYFIVARREKQLKLYQNCIRSGLIVINTNVQISHPNQIIAPFLEGFPILSRSAIGRDTSRHVTMVINSALKGKPIESYTASIRSLLHSRAAMRANIMIRLPLRGKLIGPCASEHCNGWVTDDGEKLYCSQCLNPKRLNDPKEPESYCLRCKQHGVVHRMEKREDVYENLVLLPYETRKMKELRIHYCPHCHYTYLIMSITEGISGRHVLAAFSLGVPDDLRTNDIAEELKRETAYEFGPKFISRLTNSEILIDISRQAQIDTVALEDIVIDDTLKNLDKRNWYIPTEVLKHLAIFALLMQHHNNFLEALRKNEETPTIKQLYEYIQKILNMRERPRRRRRTDEPNSKRQPEESE